MTEKTQLEIQRDELRELFGYGGRGAELALDVFRRRTSTCYGRDHRRVRPRGRSWTDIYAAMADAGYAPGRAKRSIGITGMSCANCADANRTALESVPGVVKADVNYATDEGTVEYPPAGEPLGPLRRRRGRGVRPSARTDADAEEAPAKRPGTRRCESSSATLVFGAVLAVPLLRFMFEHLFFPGWWGCACSGIAVAVVQSSSPRPSKFSWARSSTGTRTTPS